MSPVRRLDVSARIRTDMRTPQGFARIPANLTRTGVLEYMNPDGSTRRELRPAEEVFRADSLRTLDTAAVTVGHPAFVDASNWRDLSVGSVRDVRRDGGFVAADVVVNERGALDRVDAGDLVELSCGYDCDLETKAGTFNGERYDAIQRNIKYNHVALLPSGTGRAGGDVRLRLDSNADASIAVSYTGGMSDDDKKVTELQAQLATANADAEAIRADRKAAQKRADAAEAKADGLAKQLDEANAKLDAATKRADSAESNVAPERLDALVGERVELVERATILHGKRIDAKGTALDIKSAALAAYEPGIRLDGKSSDYVDARFDVAVEAAIKAGKSLATINEVTGAPRADALENDITKAQRASHEYERGRFAASLKKGA